MTSAVRLKGLASLLKKIINLAYSNVTWSWYNKTNGYDLSTFQDKAHWREVDSRQSSCQCRSLWQSLWPSRQSSWTSAQISVASFAHREWHFKVIEHGISTRGRLGKAWRDERILREKALLANVLDGMVAWLARKKISTPSLALQRMETLFMERALVTWTWANSPGSKWKYSPFFVSMQGAPDSPTLNLWWTGWATYNQKMHVTWVIGHGLRARNLRLRQPRSDYSCGPLRISASQAFILARLVENIRARAYTLACADERAHGTGHTRLRVRVHTTRGILTFTLFMSEDAWK